MGCRAPPPRPLRPPLRPPDDDPPSAQAILQIAVDGRLIAPDPGDEDATVALRRLEAGGGNPTLRRGLSSLHIGACNTAKALVPPKWGFEPVARLLQIGAIVDVKDGNHGELHPKAHEFTAEGEPFITAAQVNDRGIIDYEGAKKLSGTPLARLRVGFAKKGDVIFTHKGSVGRVAVADRECVLTPQTTYYRLNSKVLDKAFMRYLLLSPFFQRQVDLVKSQTTRDFVPITTQYSFTLKIPPINEQRRIAAKLDTLMAICDELEDREAKVLTLSESLLLGFFRF